MIFKSEPNMYLMISTKRVKKRLKCRGITFDENGLYETDKPDLIQILSARYEIVEDAPQSPTIDLIQEAIPKLRQCKKCGFECDNQGDLLVHYRSAHPKNKGGN